MLHKVWPGENTKTSKLLSIILYALSCTCKGKFGKIKKKRREPQEKTQRKGEWLMYYIGIDLGTSAVKLLLMQGDG